MVYLKDFQDVGSSSGLPLKPIAIKNCGQLCGHLLSGAFDIDVDGNPIEISKVEDGSDVDDEME